MRGTYDDQGIRFTYPTDWELEVADDGPRRTIALQSPNGLAFAMVTIDEDAPDAAAMIAEALAAMREEYPHLEATPAFETIDGHPAEGHDLEFFSLDMLNGCAIRGVRTPRRTVLIFGQWSEMAGDDAEADLLALRRSLEETDS